MGKPQKPEKPLHQEPETENLRCKVTGANCDIRPVILQARTTGGTMLQITWLCVRCKQNYISKSVVTEAPGGGDAYCVLLFKPSPIVDAGGGEQVGTA